MSGPTKSRIHEQFASGQPLDCLVIDSHAHLLPEVAPHATMIFPDPIEQLVMMDRIGVNISCVSTVHPQWNDLVIDAITRYPDRFIGFASINPRYPDVEKELVRCFSAGMRAIGELHPTTYGHNISVTDDRFRPVWEFAVKQSCPVLIHSGPTSEAPLCGPKLIAQVASWYPSVPFIVGHCGAYDSWSMLEEAVEVTRQHDNLYLEICAMGRFYGVMEYMVNKVGAERVLYGSDAPMHDFTAEVAHVAYAKISDDAKERIFGLNIKRLLRL